MKKTVFTGSGVAIITPMHSDGSVNYEVLKELIEFQIKNGTEMCIRDSHKSTPHQNPNSVFIVNPKTDFVKDNFSFSIF